MATSRVPLLTVGQVADLFSVSPSTVAQWERAGRLRAVRTPGNHRRFRRADVDALYVESFGELPEAVGE